MTPADQRSRPRRRVLGAALAIAVLLVLLCGLLAWQPAALVRVGLSLFGNDEITFEDLRIGLHELELSGLQIGAPSDQRPPDHRVDRLRIDYRPRDLLRGRIEAVSVEGLTLRGRLDRDGFRLAGLGGPSPAEPVQLPPLPRPGRVSIRDARIEVTTPLGALAVPFGAELRPQQDRAAFVLDADQAALAAPAGRLRVDLHVEGELPLDPRSLAAGITASGRAGLRAEALSLPGVASGVDGGGDLAFVFERGELEASLSSVRLQLEAIAPEWSTITALLPAPWSIEFAEPAGLSASFAGDGTRLEGSGQLALATAGPQLAAAFSTALTLAPDGRIRELVVPDGEITLRDLRLAGMSFDRGVIRLEGAGAPGAWQGAFELELSGSGAPWPGVTFSGGSARAGLDARLADGRLRVSLRDAGVLRLAELSRPDDVRIEGLEVRLEPSSLPLLTAELAGGAIAWRQHVTASVPAVEVMATAGTAPVRLTAEAEALQIELAGDGERLDHGRVVLSGGEVRAPAQQLRLAGVAAEANLVADGIDPDEPASVTVASIVHEGEPPWFAPLRLVGSVRPQEDRLAFDVEIGSTAGEVAVRLRGEHELANAEGHADVELAALDFAPDQLQPMQLAPVLRGLIEDVSGHMALDGRVRWGTAGGMEAALDLLVENLAFTSGPARFAQVNGVIAIDQLMPLSSPPGQQLAVGLIDIGLPLTNGLLTFDLQPWQLAIEQLRWQFAQGRIRAAPFTIGSAGMRFSTTLTAELLSLDEIFALTQLDGLSGQGTMHGTLPITVDGTDAVIEAGELVSDAPGWVRYRPDQAPAGLQAGGENVNLLLQALENFHYDELRLTIDGRTDGEMDVGLHISGANPDLYDGYPIEFNLNLEGALADVLRAGLVGYRIPERIRERMQGFGR